MAYEVAPLWTGEYLHPGDAGLPAYAPYGYQWIGKRGMQFTAPIVRGVGRLRGMGTCADNDPSTGFFNPLDPSCWATVLGQATPAPPSAVATGVGPTLPGGYDPTTGLISGMTPAESVAAINNDAQIRAQQALNAQAGSCPYGADSTGKCLPAPAGTPWGLIAGVAVAALTLMAVSGAFK